MNTTSSHVLARFEARAREVSAHVVHVHDEKAAAAHIAALVRGSPNATVFAPDGNDVWYTHLERALDGTGARLHRGGLREHGGCTVGVTRADWGIAETGTVVVNSANEEVRLASMLAETHVVILDATRVRPDLEALASDLGAMLNQSPGYTAFITGPSRTADIESVLALGAHGPRAVHILLVGTEQQSS